MRRGWTGVGLAALALLLTQVGHLDRPTSRLSGPSQGILPRPGEFGLRLARAAEPGLDQRGPGTEPEQSAGVPASTRPEGGGGGGGQPGDNIFPALEGNPNGIDAVPTPSPSPMGGGGGGGPAAAYGGPFILVLPPPTPSPTATPGGRVNLF